MQKWILNFNFFSSCPPRAPNTSGARLPRTPCTIVATPLPRQLLDFDESATKRSLLHFSETTPIQNTGSTINIRAAMKAMRKFQSPRM